MKRAAPTSTVQPAEKKQRMSPATEEEDGTPPPPPPPRSIEPVVPPEKEHCRELALLSVFDEDTQSVSYLVLDSDLDRVTIASSRPEDNPLTIRDLIQRWNAEGATGINGYLVCSGDTQGPRFDDTLCALDVRPKSERLHGFGYVKSINTRSYGSIINVYQILGCD